MPARTRWRFWMWVHSRDWWWERVVPKEFRDGEWREKKLWSGLNLKKKEKKGKVSVRRERAS